MKKPTLAIASILLILVGGYMFYETGSQPVDKTNVGSMIFTVQKGEGLKSIANRLQNEGLIRNKTVFFLTALLNGIDKKIQAGDFTLSKNMSSSLIAKSLTHGTADVWVTIIEGLRKEEIAAIMAQNFRISAKTFIERAREGYLFPDTYLIPKLLSEEQIIKIMTDEFERKYSPDLRQKVASLGLTDRQALIIASLVEKEAQFPEDKKVVAGIIIKRFKDDWLINIDATIQYALGYQRKEKTWWKKELTIDDMEVDSTYNTYKYSGLPPAPICNPGLESLSAVANAQVSTPYWYYITDKKGVMHYGKTLEEHNANIRKYLQ